MRNLVRVVVLDRFSFCYQFLSVYSVNPSVVDFLLFLGKLVIVLITSVTSYMAFSGQIPEFRVNFNIQKILFKCYLAG